MDESAEVRTCPRCGTEATESARICQTCGLDLANPDETYVLSGSGMPQSERGWIVLLLFVVVVLILAALGIVRV